MLLAGHRRQPSAHSVQSDLQFWDDVLDCVLLNSVKAHQRPVNFLQTRAGRLLTASQDYTLKVRVDAIPSAARRGTNTVLRPYLPA